LYERLLHICHFISLLTDGNALLFYKTITAKKLTVVELLFTCYCRLKKSRFVIKSTFGNFMKKLMFSNILTPFLVLSQSNGIIQHYLSTQVQK
jgi:hypothetical protein